MLLALLTLPALLLLLLLLLDPLLVLLLNPLLMLLPFSLGTDLGRAPPCLHHC